MKEFNRKNAPSFLKTRWQGWGGRYKQNKTRNNGFNFQWPTYQGKKINTLLEKQLKAQTQKHCSYCDNYPVRKAEDSIDHFKPKGDNRFYHLVCQWENLYYCCHNCQMTKGERFNNKVLRPDDLKYNFATYFIYNFRTHKLKPNPKATKYQQKRADLTIQLFGLNDCDNPTARRISKDRYDARVQTNPPKTVKDFAFRFILH